MMFNCLAILLMYCIIGVAVIFVSSIVVELIIGLKRVIKMTLNGENPVTIARKIDEANNAGLKAMKNATEFDPIFKRVYNNGRDTVMANNLDYICM